MHSFIFRMSLYKNLQKCTSEIRILLIFLFVSLLPASLYTNFSCLFYFLQLSGVCSEILGIWLLSISLNWALRLFSIPFDLYFERFIFSRDVCTCPLPLHFGLFKASDYVIKALTKVPFSILSPKTFAPRA